MVDVETTLEVAKLVIVGRFNKLEQISNFAALIIVLKAPSRWGPYEYWSTIWFFCLLLTFDLIFIQVIGKFL